ncbi:hypothetical protein B296_00047114 [Ensete ventricosum]|uniref:Uncharacterized protein n=1 Tax=Ensete ventricosum TaxID=4639 RepID=A0A426XEH2_ENSVE|nr:hypothetical protein B296_00047114 [Ensete ventricosum]
MSLIFTIFGCVQKLQSTPTHLQSRHFRLLYRQNHRTTSHSERFIRCLPLPFLHRATILSNRIYGSRRRIPLANLRPQQTLLGRCLFSTAPPPPACSHLQPNLLRYSPPLCSIFTVSTSLPIVAAPPPRSDQEHRSTSHDRHPCSPKPDLQQQRGHAPSLCSIVTEPSLERIASSSVSSVLKRSFTSSAPRLLTAALNPQAYMGIFFHQFYSNCCSSPLATSASVKRLLLPLTAVELAPAAASKPHRLFPSATDSSLSEAPSIGSLS